MCQVDPLQSVMNGSYRAARWWTDRRLRANIASAQGRSTQFKPRPEARGIAVKKTLFAAAAATLLATSMPLYAQQMTTKQQLVGTWRVVTLKATSGGKVSNPLGDHPAGYVSVTPTRIWLLFVDSTRKAPAAATLTDAEAIAAMKTSVAWTGKYVTSDQTAEGIKLTSHVDTASSEALNGTDRVYFMRVDGSKLMMKSPGVIVPMTGLTSIIEIELVKAD
jgi:hypothetical protein